MVFFRKGAQKFVVVSAKNKFNLEHVPTQIIRINVVKAYALLMAKITSIRAQYSARRSKGLKD